VSAELERLNTAERMLAEIATASDAVDVIRYAEAARVWAEQARLGNSAANSATSIKLRAERRLADAVDKGQEKGEIATKQTARQAGSSPDSGDDRPSTLDDIGVDSRRLAEARKLRDAYTDRDIEEAAEDASAADRALSRSRLLNEARSRPKPEVTVSAWSPEETELGKRLDAGETIVISMRAGVHPHLYAWAEKRGLMVRIDRRTEWGNPFEIPGDGDRDTVIAAYRDYYLPHKPSLLATLPKLRGRALGCWCAPEACHGDVLKEWAER
jgi:hypothetical protein